jgi:hypothetical protein
MTMNRTDRQVVACKPRTTPPTARTSALWRDLTALLYRQIVALPEGRQRDARAAAGRGSAALRAHLWDAEPAFRTPGAEAPGVQGVLTFVFDHVDWAALATRLRE